MANSTAIALSQGDYPLENAIAVWLHEKGKRTNSAKTRRAYEDTLASFRAMLHRAGLDLDSPSREVSTIAQGWAALLKANGTPVSASTHNQRLAIVSSFYTFTRKRQVLHLENPIEVVERMPVQSYGSARPLSPAEVQQRIQVIDRGTPSGKRDYAIIAIALQTGRRLSELTNMRVGSMNIEGEQVTITFRAKGGKIMRDTLLSLLTKALLDYLDAIYPEGLAGLAPDAPMWIDLHVRNRGTPLTARAVSNIWRKRLGTGKVHTTRHTFAHGMEQVGAKVSDIQGRLGHSSLAVTGKYLAALKAAKNEHGEQLAALFGFN